VLCGEPPADLYDRAPDRPLVRVQADETDELGHRRDLHGPQAPAALHDRPIDPVGELVRTLPRQRLREPFHHPRVRVDGRERLAIRLPPGAQHEALGPQEVGHGPIVPGGIIAV
jgi:hypothetical protein